MRINTADTIGGLPILTVRAVLHRLWRVDDLTAQEVADALRDLQLDPRKASRLLKAMVAAGYLERVGGRPGVWCMSREGAALTWAHATRPIRRRTAERLLAGFLERVRALEGWKHPYAFGVAEVVVYGSYLRDVEDLGDVDLAVELLPRYSNPDAQFLYRQERIRAAERASGQLYRWRSIVHELDYPYREVMQYLRARKRSLSFLDLDGRRAFVESVPHRPIYRRPAEDGCLQGAYSPPPEAPA